MMCRYHEKKELSDCGSTVLEFLHMSIMCLRMSETGTFLFFSFFPLTILVYFVCPKYWSDIPNVVNWCCYMCSWVLLEVLDKIAPGSVNWKQASKPPIKMPFRKVENCNQAVKIGKQLKFSLVNVAGSDIVQGNKKLILCKFASEVLHDLFNCFRKY